MEPGPRAHPRAAGREPPVEDKVRGDRHLGKGPDMAHTLPLMADSQALRRFGKLYLAAFWFATASLYVSLIQAGYDPRPALTSAPAEAAVGVMLVSVRSIRAGDDRMQLHKTMNLVRGELFRDADSRVYQVDEQTFAVTARRGETGAPP